MNFRNVVLSEINPYRKKKTLCEVSKLSLSPGFGIKPRASHKVGKSSITRPYSLALYELCKLVKTMERQITVARAQGAAVMGSFCSMCRSSMCVRL